MRYLYFNYIYLPKNEILLNLISIMILRERYIIQLLLFILFFPHSGVAQSYFFKRMSIQEGVSQSTVQSIVCDYKHSLWMGTKNGLNRYDGYEFKNYFNIPNDSTSLPGNNIFFVLEDLKKDLWIGTQLGICQYDVKGDNFKTIFVDNEPIYSRCYSLRKEGVIFIGNGCVYTYNYGTGKFAKTLMTGEGRTEYFTQCQNLDSETLLLSGRFTKLYLFDLKTGKTRLYTKENILNITASFVQNDQKVWVAQYNKGICVLNKKGEVITEYTTSNSELNNNIVLDFLLKQDQLWMATDGGGINVLDLTTGKFSFIEHISGEINTLPVNSITCLYEDGESNVWVGSVRGGAFGIRSVHMKTYSDVALGNSNGLSDKCIISIFEDREGNLWIGTDGGGINQFNSVTNRFIHYPNTYREKVNSIYELNKEELLLSIYGKGLFRFRKRDGKISPLPIVSKQNTDSIYSVGVPIIIHPGKNDMLYILGAGMYLLNTRTEVINYFPTPLQSFWLQPFYHSEEYSYLLGGQAIYKLDHSSHALEEVCVVSPEMKPTAACFDMNHSFYIGTTTGLLVHDLKTGETKALPVLHSTSITSMLWERNDRMWIGARNKLYSYNPIDDKLTVFGESDGVQPNELLARPVLITSTKDIYIGGNMGLLRIDKNNVPLKFPIPQLILSRIEKDGKLHELKEDSQKEEVVVPWNFSNIKFYFITKDEIFFREKKFRYTIKGSDSTIIESSKPVLSVNSLPTGKYTIIAQCDTQNGEWTTPRVCAILTIAPPWWKSAPAIIAYILICAAGIWSISLYYIRKSRKLLEKEVEVHKQKINEEKIQFLININHELRTPLTLIYAPLKRIISGQKPTEENAQLRSVFRQAQRMKSIINMVLDTRKMEVGKGVINYKSCKFNIWITSLVDDFKMEFESKEIELKLELDERIENFTFDVDKTEKAITNLLMNALKFSNSNTCVKVMTLCTENGIKISVVDQGIGLGDHPEKLFQRFYQGEHDRGGTGIGLSYSKQMVEIQGGTIGAYNNPDVGATFFIELPKRLKTDNVVCESKPYINELLSSQTMEKIQTEDISLQQYSLLVVEDEPELRFFMKKFFSDRFKKVYVAENGQIGFEKVIDLHPDIVVSDVLMPIMDGYKLCQLIKADLRCSHIPVILLTARGDDQSTLIGYKTGADAYLSKPFDEEVLISVIQTQIQNREYIKEKYKNNSVAPLLPQEVAFSNADEYFLDKLNGLIINHIDDLTLDVNFLSQEMGMSRSSLYNKMNQLIGTSVREYIIKQRLQKAEQLVLRTDMSILEIAEKCGFATQRYFSKVFKQVYGNSPSKYRIENILEKL